MYDGDDRTQQVNSLRQVADEIAEAVDIKDYLDRSDIAFWATDWYINNLDSGKDVPEWFDAHERQLLEQFVREVLDG